MALGLPVLSTDCGGIPELIEDGVEGWIVPTRNPEAMALAISDFLDLSVEEIEEVRIAARRRVEVQHSEDGMVEGMEELYYGVLEEVKNPPSASGHLPFKKGGAKSRFLARLY